MDFALTEEQEILKSSAREFLEKEYPSRLVRKMEESEQGYSSEIWSKMAQLGWMAFVFPEEYGGIGGSLMDLAVLVEEMGRAAVSSPFLSTVVSCGLPILSVGSDAQKKEFLPKIANGLTILASALNEPGAKYDPKAIDVHAVADGENYVINGTKLFSDYAHVCDHLLCVARTSGTLVSEKGITLFLINVRSSGITCNVLPSIAGEKQCEVIFDNVKVPKESVLGSVGGGWSIVQKALQQSTALKCAEMIGGAQKVLEMTISYATDRKTYGQTVASYQVVQHFLVDMWLELELAKNITYQALWKISRNSDDAAAEISMAKAWVGEVYRKITRKGMQIHGGIGVTRDHDLGLYHRRARTSEFTFGDGDFHREIVASAIGL